MTDSSVAALRSWLKRVKYPDIGDLQRIEAVYRDFPTRTAPFLHWLTSLSYQNTIMSLNLTSEEFDAIVSKESATDGSTCNDGDRMSEKESSEDINLDGDSIAELNTQLELIERTNKSLQKKIDYLQMKVKENETELIPKCVLRNETAFNQEKHLIVAREQDKNVKEISDTLLDLDLTTTDNLERISHIVDEMIECETSILRTIASSSLIYFKEHRYVRSRTAIGPNEEEMDIPLKCNTKSTSLENDSEAMEEEEEGKKKNSKRLQETRSKLLEVFYFAKVKAAKYDYNSNYSRQYF